jgi:hypothetical protein
MQNIAIPPRYTDLSWSSRSHSVILCVDWWVFSPRLTFSRRRLTENSVSTGICWTLVSCESAIALSAPTYFEATREEGPNCFRFRDVGFAQGVESHCPCLITFPSPFLRDCNDFNGEPLPVQVGCHCILVVGKLQTRKYFELLPLLILDKIDCHLFFFVTNNSHASCRFVQFAGIVENFSVGLGVCWSIVEPREGS